jgi:hypothetical protein
MSRRSRSPRSSPKSTQQLEPMVRKKGLEATYSVEDDGKSVYTDRTKLKQIC